MVEILTHSIVVTTTTCTESQLRYSRVFDLQFLFLYAKCFTHGKRMYSSIFYYPLINTEYLLCIVFT